jgi:hypothetical protein
MIPHFPIYKVMHLTCKEPKQYCASVFAKLCSGDIDWHLVGQISQETLC